MIMNLVFVSYQHKDSLLAQMLGEELQLRGVIPWIDKKPGGFWAGDPSEAEARRVIREDISGFVLVLTAHTWCSDFIKRIEVPEALARRKRDPDFWICVVSPEYGMGEISTLMRERFGDNLAQFHGYSRDRRGRETIPSFMRRVAAEFLRKHIHTQVPTDPASIEISVNSYEPVPGSAEELLRLDVYHPLRSRPFHAQTWKRFMVAVQDAKSFRQ